MRYPEWLPIATVAQATELTPQAVWWHINTGRIPVRRVGRGGLITRADMDRFVEWRNSLPQLRCRMCDYQWTPRRATSPLKCPQCHSYCWQTGPRQFAEPLAVGRRARQAFARSYVRTVRARTVCSRCGAQPIEWHHEDHPARPTRRVSHMVNLGYLPAVIQAEIDRCEALCHRCHITVDGRLAKARARAGHGRLITDAEVVKL